MMPTISPVRVTGQTPVFARSLNEPSFGKKFSLKAKKDEIPQDPKPRRGLKNVKNTLLATAGLAGFAFLLPGTGLPGQMQVEDLHQAAETRAERTDGINTDQPPQEVVLDVLADMDEAVRDIPGMPFAQSVYAYLLSFQMLSLGMIARKRVLQKSLAPERIYDELHERGLTGKGVKIGVVDSGIRPTRQLPAEKIKYLEKEEQPRYKLRQGTTLRDILNVDRSQPIWEYKEATFKDTLGHGTAVSNVIAEVLPDAEFVVIPYASEKQSKALEADLNAVIKLARRNPESLTMDRMRRVMVPMVENIALGVRKSVDEGAQAVNVSLSPEQGLGMTLMIQLLVIKAEMLGTKLFTSRENRKNAAYKNQMRSLQNLKDHLTTLLKHDEPLTAEIRELYKPWLDALDYAHTKGVGVIVAAGNAGGHSHANLIPGGKGNVNMLGAFPHPALIVVGSTDEKGHVSKFSSEYTDQVVPDIAANGSGELSTRIVAPERKSALQALLAPLNGAIARVQYENPPGTSFAAPDVTALYAMMKQANPDLSTDDIRAIMKEAAREARFARPQHKKILAEVQARLSENGQTPTDEQIRAEIQAEIRRRVGSGTLAGRRQHAVNLAEARKAKG